MADDFLGLSGSTALTPPGTGTTPAGPGQPASPWLVDGASIFYNEGGALLPATVTGGDKGKGTINCEGVYVNGVEVGLSFGGISIAAGLGIRLTPNPITASGTVSIDTSYFENFGDDFLPLNGGTLTGTLVGTVGQFQSLTIQNGIAAAPSLSIEGSAGTGLWSRLPNLLDVSAQGVHHWELNGSGVLRQSSTASLAWSSTAAASGLSDLVILRDGANALAQRNAAAGQRFNIYNTFTDTNNFERLVLGWSGNVGYIMQENAGTGVLRNVRIGGPSPAANVTIDNTSGLISVQRDASPGTTIFQVSSTGLTNTNLLHTRLTPTIAQVSGTYTVLDINPTETSIGVGPHYLMRARVGAGGNLFSVDRTGITNFATPPAADNTTTGATTAWVKTSFAPIASPSFSGDARAITPPVGDNDTSIATTKFVKDQGYLSTATADTTYLKLAGGTLTGGLNGTTANFTGAVAGQDVTVSRNLLVSGAGSSAKVPTMVYTDTSTNVATTAYVRSLFASRGQGDAIYVYNGATVSGDPTAGKFVIQNTSDAEEPLARQIAISNIDADGVGRYLLLFQPGDSFIVTNEFTPVTAYSRYDLTGYPTDHGTWVEFPANFIDSKGVITPTIGTRVKLTGYLNTATGDGPILGISAGYGISGGGPSGVVEVAVDNTIIAPLASPIFTGDPRSVTPPTADNDTTIATSAFVKNQGYITTAAANAAFQPLDVTLTALAGLSATAGLVEQTGTDTFAKRALGVAASTSVPTRADADLRYAMISHTHAIADVTGLQTALNLKAPLASPDFTGTPTAPTAVAATNTTQVATCAFVQQEIAADVASYLPLAGGILTGNLSTNGGYVMVDRVGDATTAAFYMRADAGFAALKYYQTGSTTRWTLGKTATAETGTNAGSDFQLFAYNDAGTSLGAVFTANRASRVLDFAVSPTVPTVTPYTDSSTKAASTEFVAGKVAAVAAGYVAKIGDTMSGGLLAPSLGLGTAPGAPTGTLHVRGAGSVEAGPSTSIGVGASVYVQDTGAAVGNGGMVMFGLSQGAFAAIKGYGIDGGGLSRGDLVFSTRRVNTDTTLTEALRITAAGVLAGGAGTFTGAVTFPTQTPGTANTTAATTAFVTAAVAQAMPSGSVVDHAGVAAPAGWLLCNGQAVSRTTYAALYSALGSGASPWGQGDGTATFNVPDLCGRVTAGLDNMGGITAKGRLTNASVAPDGVTRGAVGGAETVALTIAQLAAHSHGISDPTHNHGMADPGHAHGVADYNHSHGIGDPGHSHWTEAYNNGCGCMGGGATMWSGGAYTGASGTGIWTGASGANIGIYGAGTGQYNHASGTGVTATNTGSGTAHLNLQPTVLMNKIIKT